MAAAPLTAQVELRSHGGESARCELIEPVTVEELVAAVRAAGEARRQVTFRGAG